MLEDELQNPKNSSDYMRLTELQNEIQSVNKETESKMEEWVNLECEFNNM